MDAHRRPPPKDALADKREWESAVAEVLRLEEVKQETQVWEPPRQTTATTVVLAVLLFGVSIWLWVLPPAPLSIAVQPPVPTEAHVRAALRVGIALQVDRIEAWRAENGRLPDQLSQLGEAVPGTTYTRVNPREYTVRIRSDGYVEGYESGEALDVFVQDALQTLRDGNE